MLGIRVEARAQCGAQREPKEESGGRRLLTKQPRFPKHLTNNDLRPGVELLTPAQNSFTYAYAAVHQVQRERVLLAPLRRLNLSDPSIR